MRIIAKNHDYYDSALAFGHDEHVVFERMEEEHIARWKKPFPKGYSFMTPKLGALTMQYHWAGGRRQGGYEANRKGHEFSWHPFTVAFCGKLYPGIRLESRLSSTATKWKSEFAYTFEAYAALLKSHQIEFNIPRKTKWKIWRERLGSPKNEKDCVEYFKKLGEDHTVFFAEQRKPIAVLEPECYTEGGDTKLLFNCELRKYAFYKVFDAYTAFQELDMFISGVMTNPTSQPSRVRPKRPNPVDISDEDMRDKKGFDDKSFKKEPTKRR